MKKIYRLFLIMAVFVLAGTIKTYAANEVVASDASDTVAPVFDSNIKTKYIVKMGNADDVFVPENVITNVTATDDIDGSNVTVALAYNGVNLSQNGEYQVMYTATDKSGNTSYLIIQVIVDGIAPTFEDNLENLYYMDQTGAIFDSKHNAIDALPKTLVATDSPGAYEGIGVYITTDQNGNIIFLDTIKNSPSENLLQPNDILVAIDGEDVNGKTQEYAASKIKGKDGNNVKLKIIRNGKQMTITVEKKLIKLYEDEEITAKPDIAIDSINTKNGTLEITYTATDEAGNVATFVIKVIIIDESDVYTTGKENKDAEEIYNITTSGTPPENISLEIPTEPEVSENAIEEDDKVQESNISSEEETQEPIEESQDVQEVNQEDVQEEITDETDNVE